MDTECCDGQRDEGQGLHGCGQMGGGGGMGTSVIVSATKNKENKL